MKKIFSVILVCALLLCLCACGGENKKQEQTEDIVDLEYYIKLGQMPESEFALGASADEVVNAAPADETGEKAEPYQVGKRTAVNIGDIRYYYETEKKEEGICRIVSFAGGYGFENGTLMSEIEATLKKGNLEAKPETLEESELFFFLVSGEFAGIKYSFGENTACFVFDNDQLCAVTLYKNYNIAE